MERHLTLYIAGHSHRSLRAVATLRRWCSESNGTRLEIVDVLDDPVRAEREGVIATPTLVREAPPPRFRLVGDFSSIDQLPGQFREFLTPQPTEELT